MTNFKDRIGLRYKLGLMSLFAASNLFAAANFSITPIPGMNTTNTIYPGQTAYVYYKVTNKTSVTLANYTVQGLPFGVEATKFNPSYCLQHMTLASHASCILQLSVAVPGEVNFAICNADSCTTAASPFNVSLINGQIPAVSAGYYADSTPTFYPSLVASPNSGASWIYEIDSNITTLVSDFSAGGPFYSTACTRQSCVSVGRYLSSTPPNNEYGLIATSDPTGLNWSITMDSSTSPAQPVAISNTLFTTACSGSTCIAAGTQTTAPSVTFPLIATSHDAGNTWNFTFTDADTPIVVDFGSLRSSSCSGPTCIVGGRFSSPTTNPLVLTSTDSGDNWTVVADLQTMPFDYVDNGKISGVNCLGLTCIAVGSYTSNGLFGGPIFPWIFVSSDNTSTWFSGSVGIPTDYNNNGYFEPISCTGTLCMTGGAYEAMDGKTYPLISNSFDGGVNWYPYLYSNVVNMIPDFDDQGYVNSVSCSALSCVIGGNYQNAGGFYFPFVGVTFDHGATWTFPITSNITTQIPNFNTFGSINSVSCTGRICIANGSYQNTGGIIYPLIVSSQNGGKTWTYTLDQFTNPSVPGDFANFGIWWSGATSSLMKKILAAQNLG